MEVEAGACNVFGSAGQQRSSLIAYQLAQMEVHFDLRGEYPLFLMDDLDAELDEQRINRLLQVLGVKTQLFITPTSRASYGANGLNLQRTEDRKCFKSSRAVFADTTSVH